MSNLFEALTRGSDTFGDIQLEPLLDGQAPENRSTTPPQAPSRAQEAQVLTRETRVDGGQTVQAQVCSLRVGPSSPLLPFDGTHWRAGEQYRMLRTRIVQHSKRPQMFVVTSVGPNDGKTVTATNLAGVLALKSEGRVLLLDGDFRRSTISTQLGIPGTPGLADVLKGDVALYDAIRQAEQLSNLYVLPAGTPLVNPTELLDSSHWSAVCANCRKDFAHVVVDSPPMGAVADYDLLQAASDGVVLVIRPDHTDRRLCLKALQTLPKDKLLGIVVNGVDGWLLDRDRKRYGAYYHLPRMTDRV